MAHSAGFEPTTKLKRSAKLDLCFPAALKSLDQFQPLRCVAILTAHTSLRLIKRVSYGMRKALVR